MELVTVMLYYQELNCSRRAPDYFTQFAAKPHLPHAVVARLHVHKDGWTDSAVVVVVFV